MRSSISFPNLSSWPLKGRQPSEPAVRDVGLDVDHLERRQKAVVDSLAQAVGVDRLAEVVDVGYVLGLLRRRGHADLRGRREIVENPAPVAVLLRGSPVALVDDDEIEEIPAEELRKPRDRFLAVPLILGILVARKLLVEGEVHFMRSDGDGIVLGEVDLVDRLFKRGEVLLDRLVHEDVPVGEVQDLFPQAAFQQTVDDLKGRIGLPGACGHHQQEAFLSPCYRLDDPVDGVALVVPRIVCALAGIIRLRDDLFLVGGDTLAAVRLALPASGQLLDGREGVERQGALKARQKVVFLEGIAVGTVGERDVLHARVCDRLLETVGDGVVVVLGLDNGDWLIEDVVGLLRFLAKDEIAAEIDPSIRDLGLHCHAVEAPLGLYCRRDVLQLDVLFRHLFLVQDHLRPSPIKMNPLLERSIPVCRAARALSVDLPFIRHSLSRQ